MALKKFPSFEVLLKSYPPNDPATGAHASPCDEKVRIPNTNIYRPRYENQCAIRMSCCLMKAGVSLSGYTDPKCNHGYARGAESLATWIWRNYGEPVVVDCKNAKQKLEFIMTYYWDKKGIIFFKDFYGPGGTGDHIDLLYQENHYVRTVTGDYTNDPRVKYIWFWEIS